MKTMFRSLRASQITQHFPGCLPCRCYDDDNLILKIPRYDVSLGLGHVEHGYGSYSWREVVSIHVECDCCGARQLYDVERYGVTTRDLNW